MSKMLERLERNVKRGGILFCLFLLCMSLVAVVIPTNNFEGEEVTNTPLDTGDKTSSIVRDCPLVSPHVLAPPHFLNHSQYTSSPRKRTHAAWFRGGKGGGRHFLPSFPLQQQQGKENANMTSSSFSQTTYWVAIGASGSGTSEENAAGNITYVLNTYNLTNDIINVKPGVYNKSIEDMPLELTSPNLTVQATGSPSNTIIKGFTSGVFIPETKAAIRIMADGITLSGFTICNDYQGVLLYDTAKSFLKRNIIKNNSDAGVTGYVNSRFNTLTDNTFINNSIGIVIGRWSHGHHNTIQGNRFTRNDLGIYLTGPHNTVSENTMTAGIMLNGPLNIVASQRIDLSNLVKGAPIRYYQNQSGINVPKDTGQVILANCSHAVVSHLDLANAVVGMQLLYCKSVTLKRNHLKGNNYGILLHHSTYNTIKYNVITGQYWSVFFFMSNRNVLQHNKIAETHNGVQLRGSSYNSISNNILMDNRIGMLLVSLMRSIFAPPPPTSSRNTILNNRIVDNHVGVSLPNWPSRISPKENMIYHNNFRNNTMNANDSWGGNYFNNTEIGNYWDGYNGSDQDGDGIGDTPYHIPGDGGSKDYLPAMEPFNITVDNPPSLTITFPSNGSVLETSDVTVEWHASDNTSIDHYEVRLDGGSWEKVREASYTFSGLGDGDHTVKIQAVDGIERTKTESVHFIVNTSPIGGPGMIEEIAVGVGVGVAVVITVIAVYRFKVKQE